MLEFKQKDVEILSDEYVYEDYLRIRRLTLRHRTFDGGWTQPLQRDLFEREQRRVSALLPYDPIQRKIVLIEQFRPGAMGYGESPWLLEIVAGLQEKDETPENLARRETQEEAGLEVKRCKRILHYFTSPGASNERVSIFCGEVDASQAEGIHGLSEEGEDIRVHVFTVEEAFQALESGRIDNIISIAALQWLQYHEAKLQEEWR